MNKNEDRTPHYRKDSLPLVGAVALGTGVMIGAGIFALTCVWRIGTSAATSSESLNRGALNSLFFPVICYRA